MRLRGVATAVLATVCLQACDSEADLPLQAPAPQLAFEGDDTCWVRGDLSAQFDLIQNGCSYAEDGFDDETVTFEYEFHPAESFEAADIESYFVLTYEVRFADATSFGIQLVDVEPFDAAVFGEPDSLVTPDAFAIRLIEELSGAMFINYVVGCETTTSESHVDDCLEVQNPHVHYEVGFCIDTDEDSAFAHAEDLCEPGGIADHPDLMNELPTANFSFTVDYNSATGCHDASFNASPSSDPDSGSLSYSWSFEGPSGTLSPAQTVNVTREFCATGDYEVRLKVEDPAGGIDAKTDTVFVEPPPPPPLTVEINGAEFPPANQDCIWYRNVSGGVPPYSFEWRRFEGRSSSVVSDSISYFGNTGTTSFSLSLDAWDSNGGHVTDTLAVTVTSQMGFCPSV